FRSFILFFLSFFVSVTDAARHSLSSGPRSSAASFLRLRSRIRGFITDLEKKRENCLTLLLSLESAAGNAALMETMERATQALSQFQSDELSQDRIDGWKDEAEEVIQ